MAKYDIKVLGNTYELVQGGNKHCVGCVADSGHDDFETVLCKELVDTACINEIPCCSYNSPFTPFAIYKKK